MNRVNAQQARRIIDRIVGYEVSDLLWSKVWRGLSAGRVQTVALRIIVERESERERFVPVPYFSVPCTLRKGEATFPARVVAWRGEKLKFDGTDPRLATRDAAEAVAAHVRGSALPRRLGRSAASGRRPRRPPSRRRSSSRPGRGCSGSRVRRTMQIAQRLYEGKTIGERGTIGLITYMRTDSTRTADEALAAVREFVGEDLGTEKPLPPEARRFRQKKDVQDAHEAIRPTSLDLPPEAVARYLQPDELKLYRLIWNRFVASQMTPAVTDVTTVEIEAARKGHSGRRAPPRDRLGPEGPGLSPRLRAGGGDGGEGRAGGEPAERCRRGGRGGGREGPPAAARRGGRRRSSSRPRRRGTRRSRRPRFNEASLVKFLEENGIGRPSTYAEILRKIEDREYVRKKDRRFTPTPLGRVIVDLMREGFDDFFQTEYTARMEEELDEVEEGKLDWRKAL